MDDAQTAIRRLYAASVAALNDGDIPALSAFYTDDAIQLPPDRPPLVGWEAIRSSLEHELSAVTVEAVVDVREVGVAGALAYALGRHRLRVTSGGGEPSEVTEGSAGGAGPMRSVSRRAAAVTTAMVAAVLGCPSADRAPLTVRDSLGIEIVTNHDSDRVFGTVRARPELSLGGPDVEGPAQFSRIQGMLVDPAGRLWIADGQSNELRIFDADGSHWRTLGGRGQGPGEFLQLQVLGLVGRERIVLWDRGNARRTVLDLESAIVEANRLPTGEAVVPRAYGVFPDGDILAPRPTVLRAGSLEAGITLRDTLRLERLDVRTGRRTRVAVAAGPAWLWTGRQQLPLPFTINPGVEVEGESVLVTSGPDFRVRRFRDGEVVEIYGLDRPPRRVSAEELAAYRRFTTEYVPGERRDDYLALTDHPDRPEFLPAYSQLLVDDVGRTWALVYSPDLGESVWDVYDPDRRWLGRIAVPDGLQVMEVRGARLYGVWRDGLGTEHVRAYRFERPGPVPMERGGQEEDPS